MINKLNFNKVKNADRKYIKSNVINGLDLKTKKLQSKLTLKFITNIFRFLKHFLANY